MAVLTTKNFTTLVQEWAAVCQTSVASIFPSQVLSFTKGAVFRALAEAQASVSLWLQGLVLQLLTATRLATSQGLDVDSFVNDFGLIRLPANAASGTVTFARATPTNPAVILVGSVVQTIDGTQTFTVSTDTTNPAYSVNAGGVGFPGYTIAAGVTSLNVLVTNTIAGAFGNVQIGSISILQTGISGVDTVTNSAAFTNGFNAESDAALKIRFVNFINSLAKGTIGAIAFAVQSVQQGMQYQIIENPPPAPGLPPAVSVYVDDGTGNIATVTLTAAQTAVNAIRAAGVSVGVFADSIVSANVTLTIATAPGFVHPTVVGQVVAAITSFINGLGLGATPALGTLSYMQVAAIAFGVQGVIDVTNYTLNGGTSDLVPATGKVVKAGTIVVS